MVHSFENMVKILQESRISYSHSTDEDNGDYVPLRQSDIDYFVATINRLCEFIGFNSGLNDEIISLTSRRVLWNNESMDDLQKRADAGGVNAMFELSKRYYAQNNPHDAFGWLYRSADGGSPEAMYYLGRLYLDLEISESEELGLGWLKKAAEQGYAEAQYALGDWYLEKDKDEYWKIAYPWIKSAAEQGHAKACYALGTLYGDYEIDEVSGKSEDYREQEVYWIKKAADQGLWYAEDKLYWLYRAENTEQSLKLAYEMDYNHAQQGDYNAMIHLSQRYYRGQLCEKNEDEAFRWFKKAYSHAKFAYFSLRNVIHQGEPATKSFEWMEKLAEQDVAKAHYQLGLMYLDGIGTERSKENAYEQFLMAAGMIIHDAWVQLGDLCLEPDAPWSSDLKAFRWFKRASEADNNKYAQLNLARMYLEGRGVEQNEDVAHDLILKSLGDDRHMASSLYNWLFDGRFKDSTDCTIVNWIEDVIDDIPADEQYRIAEKYYNGDGIEQSYEKAFMWAAKAADKGSVWAQCLLGEMYHDGNIPGATIEKSYYWFKKAADGFNPRAELMCAIICYSGEIEGTTYEEAFDYVKRSLEHDLRPPAIAYYLIGRMYLYGHGTDQDDDLALVYLTHAADDGFDEAQFLAGLMHYEGRGADSIRDVGIELIKKAAEQGHEQAKAFLEELKNEPKP